MYFLFKKMFKKYSCLILIVRSGLFGNLNIFPIFIVICCLFGNINIFYSKIFILSKP